jgi:hypothetical protein
MKYEVTGTDHNITKTMSYEAVRVMINSNSTEKMRENFKKLDDLQVNDSIALTDNYGSVGGGPVVIERVA